MFQFPNVEHKLTTPTPIGNLKPGVIREVLFGGRAMMIRSRTMTRSTNENTHSGGPYALSPHSRPKRHTHAYVHNCTQAHTTTATVLTMITQPPPRQTMVITDSDYRQGDRTDDLTISSGEKETVAPTATSCSGAGLYPSPTKVPAWSTLSMRSILILKPTHQRGHRLPNNTFWL